jgi:hypothetical protein
MFFSARGDGERKAEEKTLKTFFFFFFFNAIVDKLNTVKKI